MSVTQNNHCEWVWVQAQNSNSEFGVPFGARIIRTDDAKTLICDDAGKQYWVASKDIVKSMHLSSQQGVDDMITLGDLQEYTILRNLEQRYDKKQIYTYIGSMLIAINPYQKLSIFTTREINLYRNRKLHELLPHIFAISDNAYQQMQRNRINQCIVISGESGAGKTESTKLILQYMAAISGKKCWIEQQIIDANPILEAFGNAKTVRNDNSSRFGKYIEIGFDKSGSIQSAKIVQYLLEKSRIVTQHRDERNYHIFYCMLAGLTQRELAQLELVHHDVESYHYLSQSECFVLPDRDDAKEFTNIRAAMRVLSFSDMEVWNMFKLLAAILHLGNLKITATIEQNTDASQVKDEINAKRASALLGVSKNMLNDALTQKTMFVYGEYVVMNLSRTAAIEGRDAFVKSLYGYLFEFIVKRINAAIDDRLIKTNKSIGVLDIFGFENFTDNSFEQLCINYANENLQQFFVRNIFKMEQAEYENEGIKWVHIDFKDNQDMLDLIGLEPMNIMSLIDEETKFPRGTDQSLLDKLHKLHGTRSIYVKPKTERRKYFGVRHYAGVVMYNAEGFLEKNRDSFSVDLRTLLAESNSKFIKDIFPQDLPIEIAKKQATLSVKFRNSLDDLMQTLSASHPFFIRCIKPNEHKAPNCFDRELCVRQLRYAGMMETARIRRAGYPIRHTFKEFVERYRMLLAHNNQQQNLHYREATCQICNKVLSKNADFQCGRQKVFLKDIDDAMLESARARIVLHSIKTLQRGFRNMLHVRRAKRKQEALQQQQQARRKLELESAIKIQRHWRSYKQHKQLNFMRLGIRRLAASIASRQLSYRFVLLRRNVKILQAYCRGYLARLEFTQKLKKHRELIIARKLVEQKLKNGVPKQIFDYHEKLQQQQQLNAERLTNGSRAAPQRLESGVDEEFSKRIVDDVFGFLDDADITGPTLTSVREKSQMFEREFRLKKHVPSKLLSRPVNYYEASPDTTRL